jgi:hypothetical protein
MFGPILVAALLTAPSPQPTASPALKTIASVRASARCAEIITHANSAIGTTLDNDAVLGKTITTLRFINLDDGNPIHRRNGLNSLGDLAKTLMQQARSGDNEVKRLRALAAKTKDPKAAKDLKDFADELGGALWRQQKIARDLNGYLAYEDFRDMATPDESQRQAMEGASAPRDAFSRNPAPRQGNIYDPNTSATPPNWAPGLMPGPNTPTATQYAKAAADDFQNRISDIVIDENHAATHVDGALSGCSNQ